MKSLLKNSRQSFITQVSYGVKNMVVPLKTANQGQGALTKQQRTFFKKK